MQRNSVTNLEEKPVPTSGYIIFGILLAAQGLAFLSTVLLGFQSNKLPINDIFLSIALSNILLLPISAGEYFHRPLRPNNSGMAAVSGVCAVAGMLCCFISSVWIDPSTFAFIFSLALLFFYMSIDAIRSQSYYRASFYHRGIGTTIAVLAICGFQLSEMLLEFRPLIMWATVVSVLVFVVVRAIRTVRFRRRLVLLSIVRFGKFLGLGGDMVTRNFVLMGLGLFSAELEAVFLRLMQQASGAIGSVLGNINYVYNVKMVREQERGQQRIWSIFRSVIRRNSLITLVLVIVCAGTVFGFSIDRAHTYALVFWVTVLPSLSGPVGMYLRLSGMLAFVQRSGYILYLAFVLVLYASTGLEMFLFLSMGLTLLRVGVLLSRSIATRFQYGLEA